MDKEETIVKKIPDIFPSKLSFDDILQKVCCNSNLEIKPDSSAGDFPNTSIYEVTPQDYLETAAELLKNEAVTMNKEIVIRTLNGAIDEEIDIFLTVLNISSKIKKKNLSAKQKLNFIYSLGLIPKEFIDKIISIRNEVEHEYVKVPESLDIKAYYELVVNAVRIIELFLELIIVRNQLEFSVVNLKYDIDAYALDLQYNQDEVSFKFEIRYLHRKDIPEKGCVIKFDGSKNISEFEKGFKFFLIMMKYSIDGNTPLMKKNVKKIIDEEDFWI